VANKPYIERLQKAIKDLHGCESEHVETVPVHETFQGQTVWRDNVEVFEIKGHPKAVRCYAWAFAFGTGKEYERFYAVLQLPPVLTATDAVRAAIASEVSFGPQPGKIYKVIFPALERGKTIIGEADLLFENEGKRAYIVLEWWPNTGKGDVPKVTVEIDPAYLQQASNQKFDFFYQGQISIPQVEGN